MADDSDKTDDVREKLDGADSQSASSPPESDDSADEGDTLGENTDEESETILTLDQEEGDDNE